MNIKQIIKYAKVIQDNKTMCKCGHSVFIPNHLEKIVCNWCGNYVFKDKKNEFKFRIKEAQNKN